MTPAAGTIKSRAKSRLTALREMHGWNTDSPLIIRKARITSAKQKERERLAQAKRMKHLGMVEELAPYGMTNRQEIKDKMTQRDKELAEMKLRVDQLEAKIKADHQPDSQWSRLLASQKRTNEEAAEWAEARREVREKAAEVEARAAALDEKEGNMRAAMEIEMGTKMEAEEQAQSARIDEMKMKMEEEKEANEKKMAEVAAECERKVAEAAAKYHSKLQKEQSKMKEQQQQQGAPALRRRVTELEKENRKIQGQLTKIKSRKRGHDDQRHRRSVLRNIHNTQETTKPPATKKRNTKNSTSSPTDDN